MSLLTFTPRHDGPGFRLLVTDADQKRLGQITVNGGVPCFEPRSRLLIEAELRAIANAMRRLEKRI